MVFSTVGFFLDCFSRKAYEGWTGRLEIAAESFHAFTIFHAMQGGAITTLGPIDKIFMLSFGVVLAIIVISVACKVARQCWNWQLAVAATPT